MITVTDQYISYESEHDYHYLAIVIVALDVVSVWSMAVLSDYGQSYAVLGALAIALLIPAIVVFGCRDLLMLNRTGPIQYTFTVWGKEAYKKQWVSSQDLQGLKADVVIRSRKMPKHGPMAHHVYLSFYPVLDQLLVHTFYGNNDEAEKHKEQIEQLYRQPT